MNTAQVISRHSSLINDVENIDIQILTGIITKNINEWLNKKPTNSKRNLTIITGLARNSVNQLSRGLGSIVNMHPSKIIHIIATTEGLTNQQVSKKYEKELKSLLKLSRYKHVTNTLDSLSPLKTDAFESAINIILTDYESTIIYILSTMNGGISKDEIRSILGRRAYSKIPYLAELNLVHVLGEVIRAQAQQAPNFTNAQINRMIPFLINFYNREHDGDRGNGINFMSLNYQKLTKGSIDEINGILAETKNKIDKIVSDPLNHGSNLFYNFIQADTFNGDVV